MEFRLVYEGPLKASRGKDDKHELRRHFHVQLRELMTRKAMAHFKRLISERKTNATLLTVGAYTFAPLITEKLHNVADLHITLLSPEEPGRAITQGGDLDNRLKTLLDALRVPKQGELPAAAEPTADEDPFFCLFEDDALISGLSVTTDRLLSPVASSSHTLLVIHVAPRSTLTSLATATWTL